MLKRMLQLALFTSGLLMNQVSSAKVPPDNACVGLKEALSNLEMNLKSDATVSVLEGAMTREYRTAYKTHLSSMNTDPRLAQQMAERLLNTAVVLQQEPAGLLLKMDVLAKASSEVATGPNTKLGLGPFITAATGISKAYREIPKSISIENLDQFRNQYASRIINALDLADAKESLQLFRIIEADERIRHRFPRQNNAPLSMLKALKKISPTDHAGPEIAAQLHSARAVANSWIKSQLERALSKKSFEPLSGRPQSDWALARVLANEMKRLLRAGDPAGSTKYDEADKKLARAKEAPNYLKDPQVQEWFKTYNIPY